MPVPAWYKGLIDLAYRSGEISVIQAQVVYDNDEFNFSFGLEPQLKHVPAKSDRGEPTHVYAISAPRITDTFRGHEHGRCPQACKEVL